MSRESIDTCTAKVASLETSVWHFGRTVGLLSVVRDNEDNKDFRDMSDMDQNKPTDFGEKFGETFGEKFGDDELDS